MKHVYRENIRKREGGYRIRNILSPTVRLRQIPHEVTVSLDDILLLV